MGSGPLLVADLDGTLLGDDGALVRFARWRAAQRGAARLVYATGRTRESVARLVAAGPLPEPDAVISSVGTEIHDRDGDAWPGWSERFAGWRADRARDIVGRSGRARLQHPSAQSPRKASFEADRLGPGDLAMLRGDLLAGELDATLVYSGARFLDVLPPRAGKGEAAMAVADRWGVDPGSVLVFGDSGNDVQLFEHGFRGTVVANALPELLAAVPPETYRAGASYADGVLEGIEHWLGSR